MDCITENVPDYAKAPGEGNSHRMCRSVLDCVGREAHGRISRSINLCSAVEKTKLKCDVNVKTMQVRREHEIPQALTESIGSVKGAGECLTMSFPVIPI